MCVCVHCSLHPTLRILTKVLSEQQKAVEFSPCPEAYLTVRILEPPAQPSWWGSPSLTLQCQSVWHFPGGKLFPRLLGCIDSHLSYRSQFQPHCSPLWAQCTDVWLPPYVFLNASHSVWHIIRAQYLFNAESYSDITAREIFYQLPRLSQNTWGNSAPAFPSLARSITSLSMVPVSAASALLGNLLIRNSDLGPSNLCFNSPSKSF